MPWTPVLAGKLCYGGNNVRRYAAFCIIGYDDAINIRDHPDQSRYQRRLVGLGGRGSVFAVNACYLLMMDHHACFRRGRPLGRFDKVIARYAVIVENRFQRAGIIVAAH